MTRLHRRIYLALIAVILISIVVAAISAAIFLGPPRRYAPADALVGLVAERLPPPEADRAQLRRVVAELAARYQIDLAVLDANGQVLAATSDALPMPDALPTSGAWERHRGELARWMPIGGARWLGVGVTWRESSEGAHLVVLLTALVALALGAYPIARRITRRLERLREGVEAWGEGDLGVRVTPEGKDEVADLARVFNRAAERIEALVEQQQRVLASASHELRSPLARLRMALELLAESTTGEAAEQRELIAASEGDIAELDDLIGDILLASRLEAKAPLHLEPVDLSALVAEEALRVDASVDVARPEGRVTIEGEAAALRRIVRNLVENARRFSQDVLVSVAASAGGGVTIAVEDRGPGVPEVDRERIFEPFYRPAGHRESRDGGVGLGLALVRRVAEAHGGRAYYEPREGGGSRFVVELG